MTRPLAAEASRHRPHPPSQPLGGLRGWTSDVLAEGVATVVLACPSRRGCRGGADRSMQNIHHLRCDRCLSTQARLYERRLRAAPGEAFATTVRRARTDCWSAAGSRRRKPRCVLDRGCSGNRVVRSTLWGRRGSAILLTQPAAEGSECTVLGDPHGSRADSERTGRFVGAEPDDDPKAQDRTLLWGQNVQQSA